MKAVHITADQVIGKTRTRGHMEPSQAWRTYFPQTEPSSYRSHSLTRYLLETTISTGVCGRHCRFKP